MVAACGSITDNRFPLPTKGKTEQLLWNASYSPDKSEERNAKGIASQLLPLEQLVIEENQR